MTSWRPCPVPGPAGFDLDVAVLVSPDVLDWADSSWTSRATGTPWRETWRETLCRDGSGPRALSLGACCRQALEP